MNFRRRLKQTEARKAPPSDVYQSVVRSLYADQMTLVVGTISTFIAAHIIYVKSLDPVHLVFALLLSFCGIKRIVDGRAFYRFLERGSADDGDFRRWELRYLVWGSAYVGLLGTWCLAGFMRSTDDFIHLMTVAATLAYLVGITGRNFGSDRVVSVQLLAAGVPLMGGLLLFGTGYHVVLGAFLFPFFLGIRLISTRLRNMLLDAVYTAHDNRLIAERFDAALNNISHGIAMIDSEQRFVVANGRFGQLVGLRRRDMVGATLDDLEKVPAQLRNVKSGRRTLRDEIKRCHAGTSPHRFSYYLPQDRIVEASYHPMENGGVVLLEDITVRVESEEEIRKLASYDPLTHLPNRRFFMSEVYRLLSHRGELKPCSVYFLDLDKFKEINDSLGHSVGDKLLCLIADRLRSKLVRGSLICRFGGDEFVVVAPGMTKRDQCGEFAQSLIDEINQPLDLDGHKIVVGATIGIALCPESSSDPDQLLKFSDAALYQAKARGRGSYSFYSKELGEQILERRQTELDLRAAINRGELQIHYQPLFDIDRRRISTCEALLRWNHTERGFIPPSVFIPIAEETGLISQIGEFVLDEASRECLKWPGDVRVAVNVSSIQFQQTDVADVVANSLARTGLDPHRLEIEVTESSMLDSIEGTTHTLNQLSDIGVRISLDDFGTGFSSLSYLHSLPLDKVKIDRSFIENIIGDEKSITLLEGVAQLSGSLGLTVVVEGVETQEQLDLLRNRVPVDEVQGWLFGRAVPAADVRELLGAEARGGIEADQAAAG